MGVEYAMKDMATKMISAAQGCVSRGLWSRGLYFLVSSLHGHSDALKNPTKGLSEGLSPARQLVFAALAKRW